MRRARIESLLQHLVAIDTETWRIQSGSLCPPLVCGSVAWFGAGPRIEGALLGKEQCLQAFARLLDDPNAVLGMANGAFDLGVIATELAKRGVDAMPWIFRALEDGRLYDLQVAAALDAIATGTLGLDPRTGSKLKNPETGKPGSYSLSMCVSLTLGREDAKANDEWRLNYHMLDGVPIEQWPPAARDYPVDDAKNTAEIILAQTGHVPSVGQHHFVDDAQGNPICVYCGTGRHSSQCVRRLRQLNLHEVAAQTYSAFALHLGAAHGFRVDQAAVDVIERYYTAKRDRLIAPFIQGGLIREEGSEDQSAVKRLMAIAYGASEPCPYCRGTGKIPSPKQKPLRCPDCKGSCLPDAKDGPRCRAWRESHPQGCATCNNTGLIPHPNPKMVVCCIPAHGEGDDEEGAQKTCDGTGFVLPVALPRAEKGGVAIGRDPLIESGDEYLMSYGYFKEDQKILGSYVPYLRRARVPAAGHVAECPRLAKDSEDCTCSGPWVDIPLTLRPNAVLETGRVSYGGVIQLFPRKPGFIDDDTKEYIPSLRECIVPRGPNYSVIEVPDGYVLQSGEYAQVAAC